MIDVLKYSVFIICVASLGAVKFRCDYSYVDGVGWFKYHEIPATWSDARLRCRFEGAMLASPTRNNIRSVMMSKMRGCEIFTGIHATVSPGSYYTIDGIPLDAFHYTWANNEPDNKDDAERCISLNCDGKLSDVRCDKPYPYICHRPDSTTGANICGTTDPEYRYETRTDKCYKFHTVARQFKRAHFVCSAEGGHLAIINSETEAQVIREIFAKYPPNKILSHFAKDDAFMGFHNYGEGGDFTTVEGQTLEEAGYAKFADHEPNNSSTGEYCGSIYRNALYNDLLCENHYAFICEKKTDYPEVCNSGHSVLDAPVSTSTDAKRSQIDLVINSASTKTLLNANIIPGHE